MTDLQRHLAKAREIARRTPTRIVMIPRGNPVVRGKPEDTLWYRKRYARDTLTVTELLREEQERLVTTW